MVEVRVGFLWLTCSSSGVRPARAKVRALDSGVFAKTFLITIPIKYQKNAIFRVKPVLYTPGQSLFAITVRLKT